MDGSTSGLAGHRARDAAGMDLQAQVAGAQGPRRMRVLAALAIRETTARFGRSWGGYLWALAEPVGGIAILAFAFSFVVARPPLGDSFIFFYATGIVPFLMYAAVAQGAMNAISANRNLMAYPAVTALDAILARGALDTLTHTAVAAIVFGALLASIGAPQTPAPAAVALALALAAALGLGVGTLNAVLIGFFPAWRQVWSVINRPLFIASGVLFNLASLPAELRAILWFNPVAHVIAIFRTGFYGPEQALPGGFALTLFVAGGLFVSGAMLVRRHQAFLAQA